VLHLEGQQLLLCSGIVKKLQPHFLLS